MTELERRANEMRSDIVRMIAEAGSGHPGGSLSCADILAALYFGGVLDHDPERPDWEERDRFILAKGHAAPALYAVLAQAGYFPREELLTLRKLGTRLQGHPDSNLVPGVEVSTGSLGQGLSVAAGAAAGLKLDGKPQSVFALLGDGECQEGQVWEAAMFAAHRNLDNLVAVVDRNCLQIDGDTADVCDPGDLAAKFQAFGWDAREVDGHDMAALVEALAAAKADRAGRPHALIARTVKGKGVSFMENQAGWHGKAPNAEQMETALAELADAGVFCGVLFTPTLPFATDDDATVRGVVEGAAAAGARFVYHMTGVTMRDRQRDHFLDRIAAVDPTLPERYRAAFGDRYFCNSPRATENRALFRSLCKQHGLLWRMSDIIAAYKPSQPMGAQTSLF